MTRPPHMRSSDPRIDRQLAVIWQRAESWRRFQLANQNNPFAQLLRAARSAL